MISPTTSPGSVIFCQSCKCAVAIVDTISVDATPERIIEKIIFQHPRTGDKFEAKKSEACEHCKTTWFFNGHFLDFQPQTPSPSEWLRERDSFVEGINFITEKSNRQGRLIASIADDLLAYGNPESEIDVELYQRIRNHLEEELVILRERVKSIENRSN